ncbi:alpha-ketoglutarate-dependent dioxygenase AlkB family protein [Legionella worsleiensis]|uniref:Fe2OG dioxygenase domain-containing protein n=1 Tax=Legionella worsleiensis TaxID=45076 RepID=A0A0W1AFH3_9GAMM|nr:alpha-ketoglutarate-dependent dioxygenase AlkB [Legionella worsleiensis]KTD80046.1 hypothetical protein Lwor_1560 [Legionella worsleiensis]STY32519.1 alpha-ketoglutarate-dependent dioxygenase AlkB [Legionella worsleiensis]
MHHYNLPPELNANILPYDGEVYYQGIVLTPKQIHYYFNYLLHQISWKPDEALIFGKHIITKRKTAWYADHPYTYTYSQIRRQAHLWTDELLVLKSLIEQQSKEQFNSCLMNLYHNGSEGMGWHSDAEKELIKNGAIASLSLGAQRRFMLKHKKSKEVISIDLPSGSLLIMKGITQTHWQHSLPQNKKIKEPRINLTFRSIASEFS